ncbi:helix-turn-helix domain-containing protein [Dysgonomonas macrotermitis]|uniref:DNA-binding transcriptional regulator, XRE-family HTH domain n=1 Tax=Dysgonomonas macrotermitis TaxID=1346286 RepID=A0A1M5GMN0_9BACT|nr:helix-turn-helix domain-containing protein [Dysgonomonas macrotermitis]SHG05040.1 DNA-binding transcriptional regulator, XRE-family HTH domain [Dysgonomonas macrotermitis]
MDTTEAKKRSDGYNAKRIREILGVKQEDLAERLGLSQRTVSKLEQTDILKDEQLEAIAKALNVPVDAIKNFNEERTINIIANTYNDEAVSYAVHYKCTFNPLEKVVELYERMLQTEREKVALLEEVLKEKK